MLTQQEHPRTRRNPRVCFASFVASSKNLSSLNSGTSSSFTPQCQALLESFFQIVDAATSGSWRRVPFRDLHQGLSHIFRAKRPLQNNTKHFAHRLAKSRNTSLPGPPFAFHSADANQDLGPSTCLACTSSHTLAEKKHWVIMTAMCTIIAKVHVGEHRDTRK